MNGRFRLDALGMDEHQTHGREQSFSRHQPPQSSRVSGARLSRRLEWRRDGEQAGWIRFRRDSDAMVLSYRSGGTPRNSRISSNELRSSGRRAGSVVPGRSSSVQVSSMGLPAVGGWPSSMEPELISLLPLLFARLCFATRRSLRPCLAPGPIRFACGLAENRS